jgi:hypothetical protein
LEQFCEAVFVSEAMGGIRLEVVCGPDLSATTSGKMEEKSCFDVSSWYIYISGPGMAHHRAAVLHGCVVQWAHVDGKQTVSSMDENGGRHRSL